MTQEPATQAGRDRIDAAFVREIYAASQEAHRLRRARLAGTEPIPPANPADHTLLLRAVALAEERRTSGGRQ